MKKSEWLIIGMEFHMKKLKIQQHAMWDQMVTGEKNHEIQNVSLQTQLKYIKIYEFRSLMSIAFELN